MLCRKERLEASLLRLAAVARTHKILNPDVPRARFPSKRGTMRTKSTFRGEGHIKPLSCVKHEIIAFTPKTLMRSAEYHRHLPAERFGIMFQKRSYNNVVLLHESAMLLVHAYQLCRYSYTKTDVNTAKRYLHRVRRYFSHWEDIYGNSRLALQFLNVISVVLRLAENATKLPGCSLRERQTYGLDRVPLEGTMPSSFGI